MRIRLATIVKDLVIATCRQYYKQFTSPVLHNPATQFNWPYISSHSPMQLKFLDTVYLISNRQDKEILK